MFAFHENVNQPVFSEIDTFAEKLSISRCFRPIRSFRFRPKHFFYFFILFCSSAFSRNCFDRSFLLFNVNDWNASATECPAVSASALICQAAKSTGQSVDPRMFRQQRPLKLESGQTIFINSTKIASSRNFFSSPLFGRCWSLKFWTKTLKVTFTVKVNLKVQNSELQVLEKNQTLNLHFEDYFSPVHQEAHL